MRSKDFPMLSDPTSVYLDYAATSQMPSVVIDAMADFERSGRANPWRSGFHAWGDRATSALEDARASVAGLVGARSDQLIFTKSTTEALNLSALFLLEDLHPGDEIAVTAFEHHANLAPWLVVAKQKGARLVTIGLTAEGRLDLDDARQKISDRTKVVALTHASNVSGIILPVRDVADLAYAVGATVVVDAAQTIGHLPVSLESLGADLMAFGAHKMYGPMGIGALVVRNPERWASSAPLLYGGGMVDDIVNGEPQFTNTLRRFEAGTQSPALALGFAKATEYLRGVGLEMVAQHETDLIAQLLDTLKDSGTVLGPPSLEDRLGAVPFRMDNVHSHTLGALLGERGLMVRSGTFCAIPYMRAIGAEGGAVRASIGFPTTKADMAALGSALTDIRGKIR